MNKKTVILIKLIILFALTVFLAIGLRNGLTTSEYIFSSSKLPKEFDGLRILHISDYHNKDFGGHQKSFIAAASETKPDIILLTGDFVDEDHADIRAAQEVIEGISTLAPAYFVTGNHEWSPGASQQREQFEAVLNRCGVILLDDASDVFMRGEAKLRIHGQRYRSAYVTNYIKPAPDGAFNILLYHGSDNFDLLAPLGYDLVFSGHSHGGIVRLPFVGGLFGNDGDLFPKYTSGMYQNGLSTLISNRGVGETKLPRFFNAPELVVVTIRHEN